MPRSSILAQMEPFLRVCAWCQTVMLSHGEDISDVTHGICAACATAFLQGRHEGPSESTEVVATDDCQNRDTNHAR